jgi:hypothetical protein
MMEKKAFDPTNRGTLARNEKKESDTHADYTGQLNVNGTEYWLNGWIKKGNEGKNFLSLSIKPKAPAARQSSEPTRKGGATGFDDFDNSAPF